MLWIVTLIVFVFPRHWMLSSIPAIGTHVALKFIKEKLIAGDLTYAEGAQALLSSVHLVTADLEAIKLLEVR